MLNIVHWIMDIVLSNVIDNGGIMDLVSGDIRQLKFANKQLYLMVRNNKCWLHARKFNQTKKRIKYNCFLLTAISFHLDESHITLDEDTYDIDSRYESIKVFIQDCWYYHNNRLLEKPCYIYTFEKTDNLHEISKYIKYDIVYSRKVSSKNAYETITRNINRMNDKYIGCVWSGGQRHGLIAWLFTIPQ